MSGKKNIMKSIHNHALMFFDDKPNGNSAYIALPNKNNVRIILPLKNFKVFKAGLGVQNIASVKNRLLKRILPLVYPFIKVFKVNRLYISQDFKNILQNIPVSNLNKELYEISAFVGTADSSNRKMTFLLLDRRGQSIGFVKYPITIESNNFILNEYRAIDILKTKNFETIVIPGKNLLNIINGKHILYQENIFNDTYPLVNSLNDLIVNSSIELAHTTREENTGEYIANLIGEGEKIEQLLPYIKMITSIIQEVIQLNIPLVTIHGDFVLYNMQYSGQRLHLIDWEYSRKGLPLFDLFHFVFQGKCQIEKKNVEKCIKEVFEEKNINYYKKYLKSFGCSEDVIKPIFKLYLLEEIVFYKKIRMKDDIAQSHFWKALIEMV